MGHPESEYSKRDRRQTGWLENWAGKLFALVNLKALTQGKCGKECQKESDDNVRKTEVKMG